MNTPPKMPHKYFLNGRGTLVLFSVVMQLVIKKRKTIQFYKAQCTIFKIYGSLY